MREWAALPKLLYSIPTAIAKEGHLLGSEHRRSSNSRQHEKLEKYVAVSEAAMKITEMEEVFTSSISWLQVPCYSEL